MEEIRVSFETAKLAKEKGFDIDCGWKLRKLENGSFTHTNSSELGIEQPTQSLLQKWLREVHNINVLVYRIGSLYSTCYNGNDKNSLYNTYEKALEKGLLEALKLI